LVEYGHQANDADAVHERPALSARFLEWLGRYGLAECAGITCALVVSYVVRGVTGSGLAAAYAGAWGETLGYSGAVIAKDAVTAARAARAAGRSVNIRDATGVATGLVTEFGPAGVLDTLLTRPAAMALGAKLLGPALGVIAGKIAADVLFYVPVIFMYERRNRARMRGAGT
jgi:hypothetical protein